jgi:hypothetical protein
VRFSVGRKGYWLDCVEGWLRYPGACGWMGFIKAWGI